jgi:hypothetical protein
MMMNMAEISMSLDHVVKQWNMEIWWHCNVVQVHWALQDVDTISMWSHYLGHWHVHHTWTCVWNCLQYVLKIILSTYEDCNDYVV